MTAPERYRFVDGEEIILADVPADIRRAAITIAFGTQSGPWWIHVKTARVVLQEATACRQPEAACEMCERDVPTPTDRFGGTT